MVSDAVIEHGKKLGLPQPQCSLYDDAGTIYMIVSCLHPEKDNFAIYHRRFYEAGIWEEEKLITDGKLFMESLLSNFHVKH